MEQGLSTKDIAQIDIILWQVSMGKRLLKQVCTEYSMEMPFKARQVLINLLKQRGLYVDNKGKIVGGR